MPHTATSLAATDSRFIAAAAASLKCKRAKSRESSQEFRLSRKLLEPGDHPNFFIFIFVVCGLAIMSSRGERGLCPSSSLTEGVALFGGVDGADGRQDSGIRRA